MAAEALSKRLPRGKYSAPPAPKDGAFFAPEIGLSPRIGPPHVPFEEARGRLGVTPAPLLRGGPGSRFASCFQKQKNKSKAEKQIQRFLSDNQGLPVSLCGRLS